MIPEQIDNTNKHIKYQFTAYIGHVNTEMGLLGEYENAINIIIRHLKDTKTRIDVVAHPVLYMMRHSLELGYKSNFDYLTKYSKRPISNSVAGSHDLLKLHKELKEHFDAIAIDLKFDKDLINEFYKYYEPTTDLIGELGATEISSFRYTHNSKGQLISKSTDTKDMGLIKDLYDKAITMLAHTVDVISPFTDYVDLLEKIPKFEKGTGKVEMTFPSFQLNSIADRLDEQYEKIDQLKWKDEKGNRTLIVLTIQSTCYLLPITE